MRAPLFRWTRLLDVLLSILIVLFCAYSIFSFSRDDEAFAGFWAEREVASQIPDDLNSFLKMSVTDLNSAGKEELITLPAVGEVLAQRILEYRGLNGSFTSWDEVKKIDGIGDSTIEKLRKEAYLGVPSDQG